MEKKIPLAGKLGTRGAYTIHMNRNDGPAAATRPILLAWLVAGTLDIGIALTWYPITAGADPLRILQRIASGLLGASAFQGGAATAALGVLCHYGIALIWTIVFFAIYPRLPLLARSRVLSSVLYGSVVSAAMTFVVVPLSRVSPRPFNLHAFLVATVILWIAIGAPLTIVAGGYYGRRPPA